MEILNNAALVIILLAAVISIGVWLFNMVIGWVKSLTADLKEVTEAVTTLTEKVNNVEHDISQLQQAVFQQPKVRYKKA